METDLSDEIYLADNLEVLQALPHASVDLIYIDPPFNTGKRQERRRMKVVQDDQHGDRTGYQGKRYRTIDLGTSGWDDVFDDFLAFLMPRLEQARRVLKPHGSFFLHIDYREVHYCKVALDGLFGRDCFQNELVWVYDYGARSKRRWSAKHDNILWYTRDPEKYTFNFDEMDRIPYMAPGLVGKEKAARGKTPTDVWWHTIVSPNGREKTGYATQKPLGVLERIIKVHSNPGDTVLDFFAGSGTTGEAAARNGRRFLLVDNNPEALQVMAKRLASYEPRFNGYDPGTKSPPGLSLLTVPDIQDDDVALLASISGALQADHSEDDSAWIGSPFAWIITRPSRTIGAIGEKLVAGWCATRELDVLGAPNSDCDRVINGKRVEIKFSRLWKTGSYRFQQLRDQEYDFAVCLGISPFNAHCWVLSKALIMDKWGQADGLPHQHGGAAGSDTVWLSVNPDSIQDWLAPCGGRLKDAFQIISGW